MQYMIVNALSTMFNAIYYMLKVLKSVNVFNAIVLNVFYI